MGLQKVLIVDTDSPSLRADITGWTGEDPFHVVHGKPIGMTRSATTDLGFNPKTVLEALAWGWKLLAPPQRADYEYDDRDEFGPIVRHQENYIWYLVKEE